jgi:hypothetical protein
MTDEERLFPKNSNVDDKRAVAAKTFHTMMFVASPLNGEAAIFCLSTASELMCNQNAPVTPITLAIEYDSFQCVSFVTSLLARVARCNGENVE